MTGITNEGAVYALDKTLDAASSVRMMVCDSAGWSDRPTEAEIFAGEVIEENGYTRQNAAPLVAATYNTGLNRAERALQSTSITAVGGTISYSGYAVVLDAPVTSNKTTVAANASNSFTVVGHGLTNGDRVLITADTGGAIPAGLTALTFYYASVLSTDTFELHADAALSGTVPITDDGSGTLRLRYCQGTAAFPKKLSTKVIDPTGPAHPFNATIYFEC